MHSNTNTCRKGCVRYNLQTASRSRVNHKLRPRLKNYEAERKVGVSLGTNFKFRWEAI